MHCLAYWSKQLLEDLDAKLTICIALQLSLICFQKIIRLPGMVVPRITAVSFFIFFQCEISEVWGPISTKFCHMFGSMFNL